MYGADEAAATLLRCVRLAPRGLHNGREARRPEASTLATSCGAGVERGHVAVALAQRLELLDEVRHEAAAPSQHQVVFDEHRPRVQPRRDELRLRDLCRRALEAQAPELVIEHSDLRLEVGELLEGAAALALALVQLLHRAELGLLRLGKLLEVLLG